MSTRSSTTSQDLIAVTDVSGAATEVREQVSRSGAAVEEATASLREALAELHRSDDEAWRRYAVDMEEAARRFDTTVGLAAARLRAERAASAEDLGEVLDGVVDSWRSRADELRVRAHVGQMDLRDRLEETVEELDQAAQRMGTVLARLRSGVGETLSSLRHETEHAFDDAADIFRGHRAR